MLTAAQKRMITAIHKNVYGRFTYVPDLTEYPDWDDYWAPIPPSILAKGAIRGDCDDFSRVCLLKCMASAINARLVFCLDENREGHLICEASDDQFTQVMYLDNRHVTAVGRRHLVGYYFIAVGPWNPQPGESRPWLEVNQSALTPSGT